MAHRLDVYPDAAGEHRWRKWSGSDKVADSGEGYSSRALGLAAAILEADPGDTIRILDVNDEVVKSFVFENEPSTGADA